MGGEPHRHSWPHVFAFEVDEGSRGTITVDRVDENRRVSLFEVRKKREPERSTIEQTDSIGHYVLTPKQRHRRRTNTVVAEQGVAETEHEKP
jgi:hypothetical protein